MGEETVFVPAEQLEAVKIWSDVMPVGRIGQPSDIGKTAVFLPLMIHLFSKRVNQKVK